LAQEFTFLVAEEALIILFYEFITAFEVIHIQTIRTHVR